MKVLRFKMLIKINDFIYYSPPPTTIHEVTEKHFGLTTYTHIKQRIQNDHNFWSEEVERFPDRTISTKNAS